MATVAHEGNPRTNSLVVAGTLDGDIFLLPQPGNGVPSAPRENPPPPDQGTPQESVLCDGYVTVTRWPSDCPQSSIVDVYKIGSLAAIGPLTGLHPECNATGSHSIEVDDNFEIVVASGVNGALAGQSIWYAVPDETPDYNEVWATYGGAVQGLPISGIALFVSADSEPCNFTGLVFLVDHLNGRSVLGYYKNGNLLKEQPTILVSGALPANGFVSALACDGCSGVGSNDFRAFDSDSLDLIQADMTTIVPDIVPPTGNMGFVWIGNNQLGEHTASWSHFTTNWTVT